MLILPPLVVLLWALGFSWPMIGAWVLGVLSARLTFRYWRRRRPSRPAPLGYVRLADRYYDGRGRFPED